MSKYNFFDDCQLACSEEDYYKKIRLVLEDNFDLQTHFNCCLNTMPNHIMILDLNTGKITFRPQQLKDKNIISSNYVSVIHPFLQSAVWLVYNTLLDQKLNLNLVLDHFYDYLWGPILTSIIFIYNPQRDYYSEIATEYHEILPILTKLD